MSRSTKSTRVVLAAAAGALALTTACSSSTKTSTPAGAGSTAPAASSSSSMPSSGTAAISLRNGVIVGSDGKTLYYNTLDTAAKITCTGGCASIWPPATGTPTAGVGLDSTQLKTTTRPDGTTQVIYFGHPLYEFSGDTAPGDKKGDGIADAGGRWIVANPSPASNTPASTAPMTTSSAPGGYSGY